MQRNKVKIFSIILVNHGKRKSTMCSAKTEKEIYKKFNSLLKENKKVMFPMRFNNEKHVMVPSEHELLIIKCKEDGDNDVNLVKDDYGKFVKYETDSEDWIVIDRKPYDIEETFWVYGYHPRLQRKDFNWIFENFVAKDAKNKYQFKTIQVFLNKLLIETSGKLEIVFCKNHSDCVRLYNKIEEVSKKNKFKYILFMGDVTKSKHKGDWIKKIQNLTNWTILKISRPSTRP